MKLIPHDPPSSAIPSTINRREALTGLAAVTAFAVPHGLAASERTPMITLDHVALAVRDLAAADKLSRDKYGLGSVEGGAHPQWGTANRIVPLGKHFIEVVGIEDVARAAANPVGQIILEQTKAGNRFVGICLATTDKVATANQLGLTWVEGSRDTKAGRLTFRSAGIERAMQEGAGWPYFFEYDDAELRLGTGNPGHREKPLGIARVEVTQDVARLSQFVGPNVPELVITQGEPDIHRIVVKTERGEIILPGRLG